jgi:hypothetical protein
VITGIRFGSLEPAQKPKQPTVDPQQDPTVKQQLANKQNKGKTNGPRRA